MQSQIKQINIKKIEINGQILPWQGKPIIQLRVQISASTFFGRRLLLYFVRTREPMLKADSLATDLMLGFVFAYVTH